MKLKLFKIPNLFLYPIFVFIISLMIFLTFYHLGIRTDINGHIELVQKAINGSTKSLGVHFLYFLILYISAFFWGSDTQTIYFTSIVILSLAITAKYLITRQFLVKYGSNIYLPSAFYSLTSVGLIFTFSLPLSKLLGGHYYLGNLPPNVWHNSTTIFLMPFALLLFWNSYEQLKNPTTKRIIILSILVLINIIIKPSFCFVFIVLYPIFLASSFGFTKKLWINVIPIIIGITLIFIQYTILYVNSLNASGLYDDSKVVISIFQVWSHFSPNIPISLLGSILFPVIYIAFYWKEACQNLLMKYTISGYIIAVIIFSLFMETGNSVWQCIVTSYILYMVVSAFFLKKINVAKNNNSSLVLSNKNKIILFVFCLHLLSGLFYIIKIFNTENIAYL